MKCLCLSVRPRRMLPPLLLFLGHFLFWGCTKCLHTEVSCPSFLRKGRIRPDNRSTKGTYQEGKRSPERIEEKPSLESLPFFVLLMKDLLAPKENGEKTFRTSFRSLSDKRRRRATNKRMVFLGMTPPPLHPSFSAQNFLSLSIAVISPRSPTHLSGGRDGAGGEGGRLENMPIKFMSQAAEPREQEEEEEPRPLVVGILIIGGVGSDGGG